MDTLLKTAFCCMACDGHIAEQELKLIENNIALFDNLDTTSINEKLQEYTADIKKSGKQFLSNYLNELAKENLTEEDQMKIISVAIKIIEADEKIEYLEIAFFKKIRSLLSIPDSTILEKFPDKENYLLPDIIDNDIWSISFNEINISPILQDSSSPASNG